ncbi:MAG TPA: aminotransferase class III-fold pyridoxal phosphate-dependent enzyme, partial [Bacteroidetes bacterium]|nr:aminotransferase class III-fold pyridoxal phosphate-dependent enzyme [Bacteroidota bacterium]
DNHFRPEFLAELRRLADEHGFLLIFDEVQTGLGGTGTWWAFEQLGTTPDLVSFGKKTQVCGFFAGPRIDEVETNVFHTSSRINSTWGGNLVDMVRAKHYIRIIEEEKLLARARETGAFLLGELQALAAEFPGLAGNPRGRGLMCAFTLPDGKTRDTLREGLFERGVLMLGSGTASVRFRPSLTITREDLEEGLGVIREVLHTMA